MKKKTEKVLKRIAISFLAIALTASMPATVVNAASKPGQVKDVKRKIVYSTYKGVIEEGKDGKDVWGKIKYKYGYKYTWKKVKGAKGYQIYRYRPAAKKWVKLKTTKKNSYTLTNVVGGESIKLRIRAYKIINGEKVFGKWSKTISKKSKYNMQKIYYNAKVKPVQNNYKAEDAFLVQNQYRTRAGVHELEWDEELYKIAEIRARQIAKDFSHDYDEEIVKQIGLEKWKEYLRKAGHSPFGENIAKGFSPKFDTIEDWYLSEGHRESMLNEEWNYGAIAYYYDGDFTYWVALFGTCKIEK